MTVIQARIDLASADLPSPSFPLSLSHLYLDYYFLPFFYIIFTFSSPSASFKSSLRVSLSYCNHIHIPDDPFHKCFAMILAYDPINHIYHPGNILYVLTYHSTVWHENLRSLATSNEAAPSKHPPNLSKHKHVSVPCPKQRGALDLQGRRPAGARARWSFPALPGSTYLCFRNRAAGAKTLSKTLMESPHGGPLPSSLEKHLKIFVMKRVQRCPSARRGETLAQFSIWSSLSQCGRTCVRFQHNRADDRKGTKGCSHSSGWACMYMTH